MKGVKGIMLEYFLKEGETPEEFEDRVCIDKLKGKIRTWDDVADIINSALDQKKGESTYRKAFKKRQTENCFSNCFEGAFKEEYSLSETEADIEDEIYKKTTILRDWANHKRRTLRDEARLDRLKEALAEPIALLPKLEIKSPEIEGNTEAILAISDWHYGDSIDNFYNKFNLKIFYKRLETLLSKTIEYCYRNNVRKLHIINLGDMFAGNIHVSNRVTAEIDVINQIKEVSEALAGFLNHLSNEIEELKVGDIPDSVKVLIFGPLTAPKLSTKK